MLIHFTYANRRGVKKQRGTKTEDLWINYCILVSHFLSLFYNNYSLNFFFFLLGLGVTYYFTQLNITNMLQTRHFRIPALWPGGSAAKQKHLIK